MSKPGGGTWWANGWAETVWAGGEGLGDLTGVMWFKENFLLLFAGDRVLSMQKVRCRLFPVLG